MTVKKFFKALSAGVQVTFEKSWGWLRFVLAACVGAVAVGIIISWIFKDVVYTILGGCAGAVFGILALGLFYRCKEVVEYAEKHDMDMKTAWKKTDLDSYDCY